MNYVQTKVVMDPIKKIVILVKLIWFKMIKVFANALKEQ